MGVPGLEPGTSPLSGVHSNQLSYRPLYKYKIYNSNYIYFHFDQVDFCDGIVLYKPEMTLYIIQGQDFDPRLNPSQNIKIGAMYSFINNVKKIKKGIPITSSIFKKDRKIKLNEKRLKEIENILKHI